MKLEQYFKGLADVTRLRMLNLLLHGELCGCDIQYVLEMSQPNVSRHLTYLKNCGLVLDRRDGPRIFYRLAEAKVWSRQSVSLTSSRRCFKSEELLQDDTRKLERGNSGGLVHAKRMASVLGAAEGNHFREGVRTWQTESRLD